MEENIRQLFLQHRQINPRDLATVLDVTWH